MVYLSSSVVQLYTRMDGSEESNPDPKGDLVGYSIVRVVGSGSFGVVYKCQNRETHETVAIKKVLQDRRFKNRELEIMQEISHPNIVSLMEHFRSTEDDKTFLLLVLEFIPETIHRLTRNLHRLNGSMPLIFPKLYIYQLARGVNYMHQKNISHRDIKPQNLLVDHQRGVLKLCDFGSAKRLSPTETSVPYICSRYYRAPELIFGSLHYTTAIDIWSIGCVFAEMILGTPLFCGEDQIEQLIEIFRILGTPTEEDIESMNPNYTQIDFPEMPGCPLEDLFPYRDVCDLLRRMLIYKPEHRIHPLQICSHPFFDDLRRQETRLPNGRELPPLFDFSDLELANASPSLCCALIPPHYRHLYSPDIFHEGDVPPPVLQASRMRSNSL